MKKALFLIIIASLFIFSCKKDPAVNAKKESGNLNYDQSYNAWSSYKKSINNSYSYTSSYGSFTGIGTQITIKVSNGSIVSRDFLEQNSIAVIKQWHEDQGSLGSHPEGGDLMTIDDVYAKAKNLWLKADPKINTIYFETKNNGLISTCGYYPNNCADDCFTGINITSITAQ